MNALKTPVKLAVVDDHNLFRKGLIKLIHLGDQENKYQILFEAEGGADMKAKLDHTNLPDIILMDIDMPDMNGYQTMEWLQRTYPGISILVISMFETEEAVIRMVRMKVKGYLSKDIEVEDMHMALESIIHNGYYYSGFATEIINKYFQVDGNTNIQGLMNSTSAKLFTQKERDFLQYVCSEYTYQQIADKMFLSPKTIDGYRESMFQKCNVKSRVSLALFAVKNGLVDI